VLEGSVQRFGNRVRVSAQLVDARSQRQLWGQTYDRDLADVFAIQSQIAMAIAEELHAKLSASEKSEIERPATNDITAFDLYTRAKNLILTPSYGVGERPNLLQAVDLFNQSVARDPSFFGGYCQLAFVHDALYFFGHDHTSARLALAETALQAASRLRPDAGETHLARAWNLYWGYLDYDRALWLSCKLAAKLCQMIRKYCFLPVSYRGVRVTGKNPRELLRAPLILTRAILGCSRPLPETMQLWGAMLNKNCGWAAYWLLNPTMPLREQYLRRPILSGEPISSRCIK